MEDSSGINAIKMDQLIIDINDYNEKIKKTLNDINDLVDKTKTYYSSKESTAFFEMHNIKSYADDMVRLKGKYSKVEADMVDNIKLESIDIEKEFAGVSNYEYK